MKKKRLHTNNSHYLLQYQKLLGLVVLLFSIQTGLLSQVHISGFVKDSLSGEVLIGANVYEIKSGKGVSTDNHGYFSLFLQSIPAELRTSFVGYKSVVIKLVSFTDTLLFIDLPAGNELEEVKIVARKEVNMNIVSLSKIELKNIPSIGAEPDILKALQLLPGIQSQNEGSSNLLVRGGGPGQNLFLIDNVPLYYVNHLGGFISVFNPDIINKVKVIKGGFPAKYGGKLSSVIDVTLKEGDRSKFRGSASIGTIGAHLTLQGPIRRKDATYIFTIRKTFTELLMAGASSIADQDYLYTYGFYDMNGKLSWQINKKSSVNLILYQGDDKLSTKLKQKDTRDLSLSSKWGNTMISAGWNYVVSPKLYSSNSISFTRYRLKDVTKYTVPVADSAVTYNQKYLSSVQDISVRSDWKYKILPGWSLDYGLQASYLSFIPNNTYQSDEEKHSKNSLVNSIESAIFLENRISLWNRIDMNMGLRGVMYHTQGYTDHSIEPRLDLSFYINRNYLLNMTYMNTKQYSQMIFTSGNFVNNEVWVPTMKGIRPASVNQFTVGWRSYFMDRSLEAEVNLYKKVMSNLITYKEGYVNLKGDAYWFSKIETGGTGASNGIEMLIRKSKGVWKGFVSYTLSKSIRQFENVNQGYEYLFAYDRPHSFAIDINRKISDRLNLNLAWIYQTGIPYTPAIGRTYLPYTQDEIPAYDYVSLVYGERNSERMKDYHRLDVALNYSKVTRNNRNATWTFSIYNVYNRQNSYYYFYNTNASIDFDEYGSELAGTLKMYQRSFFPIIPSISYKLDF